MKNKLLKGFTWLTLGAILAKILGGIYKIVLTRILGAEGFGVYQQIFPVYTFLVVLVTSGVPLGVSKLLTKKSEKHEKLKTLKLTLTIFFIISLVLTFILFIFSNIISKAQGNGSLSICYYILAPAITFSAIAGVLKGYFQSYEDFKPTAVSQIVEQSIKIVLGLGFSLIFAGNGLVLQISGAVLGVCLGDLATLVVLIYYFKKHKSKLPKTSLDKNDGKELFKIVFPIMFASLIIPLSQFVDSILVVKLLNRNFNNSMSVYLFGLQSGVVSTLVGFPSVITFSLVSVMLPNLTKDFQQGNEKNFSTKVSFAVKLILILVVPCALFVLFYPNEIIALLYSNKLDGFNVNGVDLTAKLLFWSAFNIIFLCFSQFLSICLQAREKRYLPVINNGIGMLVKLVLEIVFIPSRELNILAFALASAVGYFVIFFLNFYELLGEVKIKIEHQFWVKLGLVNMTVLISSLILMLIGYSPFKFLIVGIFSVVIYLLMLVGVKIFSKEDINRYLKFNKK